MLGIHVSKESHVLDDKKPAKDLSEAIVRDLNKLNLNCAQIFTHGPRFIKANKLDYAAIKKVTTDINLSVHSAYSTTFIWNIPDESEVNAQKKFAAVNSQLEATAKVGADKLVIHINKIAPEKIARIMYALKPFAKKSKVKIVLEMVALTADEKTYETPEKINKLTKLIGEDEKWWGWCVDTAHLWGAGVDIKTYESMQQWLNKIEFKKKILMFHLNGSSAKKGSGKDKHEIVFCKEDNIWGQIKPEESGVKAVAEFAKKYEIPIICEINRGLEKDVIYGLEVVKKMIF